MLSWGGGASLLTGVKSGSLWGPRPLSLWGGSRYSGKGEPQPASPLGADCRSSRSSPPRGTRGPGPTRLPKAVPSGLRLGVTWAAGGSPRPTSRGHAPRHGHSPPAPHSPRPPRAPLSAPPAPAATEGLTVGGVCPPPLSSRGKPWSAGHRVSLRVQDGAGTREISVAGERASQAGGAGPGAKRGGGCLSQRPTGRDANGIGVAVGDGTLARHEGSWWPGRARPSRGAVALGSQSGA